MKIDTASSAFPDLSVPAQGPGPKPSETGGEKEFSQMLQEGMDRLNASIQKADEQATGLAAGKDVDVPEAMISITKADISFKMFLQLRNKALSAYEEIMRLQF